MIHGNKSGVVLSGDPLRKWIEGGQRKWIGDRITAVRIDTVHIISAYQPVWDQGLDAIAIYREEMEDQLEKAENSRYLIIGGDHNAQIGAGPARDGIRG